MIAAFGPRATAEACNMGNVFIPIFFAVNIQKTVLNPKDCTAKCFNKQFMPQVASNMAMLSHDDILTWKLIDITFKVTVNCQYTLVREMSNNFS